MEETNIPKYWKKFFRRNKNIIDDIIKTLDNYSAKSQNMYYPDKELIFDIFHRLSPKKIKVIMVGQSPYPNENACGIPFVTSSGETTKTLENLHKELKLEYPDLHLRSQDMNTLITKSWIRQGVFLLNMSMTIGKTTNVKENYLEDHSVIWEEFIRNVVSYITRDKNIPVILMGSASWVIDNRFSIKVPHPVSRNNNFIGCGVFLKCNSYLSPEDTILWMSGY